MIVFIESFLIGCFAAAVGLWLAMLLTVAYDGMKDSPRAAGVVAGIWVAVLGLGYVIRSLLL